MSYKFIGCFDLLSGRLLTSGIDEWVHLNCCLWSKEVYETVGGALRNVTAAVKRSKQSVSDVTLVDTVVPRRHGCCKIHVSSTVVRCIGRCIPPIQ